jgi:hypothetical protein
MTYFVSAIPSGHIRNVLPEILPLLDRAVAPTRGRCAVDDLLADLLTGGQVLWCAFDPDNKNKVVGIVVTQIWNYKRRRALEIAFCSGSDLANWIDPMFDMVMRFAVDNQCSLVEFTGEIRDEARFLAL